jgi:lysophospholipase L1-like esterase
MGEVVYLFLKEERDMKLKCFSILLVIMLILSTFTSTFVFAKTERTPKPKLNIVALGDSITFGYPAPSTTGFPDFISGARNVEKFGGSGATSSQLLAAIQSNPKEFKRALKKADVITINIGSNDLMQATNMSTLLAKLQPLVPNLEKNLENGKIAEAIHTTPLTPPNSQQLIAYTSNVAKIIATVKKESKAPIILYNLYNPIVMSNNLVLNQALLGPLHTFVEGNLMVVNGIIQPFENTKGIFVVDSYSTMKANPPIYIIPFDIHPTIEGQKALALLAESTLQSIHLKKWKSY